MEKGLPLAPPAPFQLEQQLRYPGQEPSLRLPCPAPRQALCTGVWW